jgi:hypothetical protein
MYRRLSFVETSTGADIALVDLEVVKDELDIADSAIDARLTRWIVDGSSSMEKYVGRFLRARDLLETFQASSHIHRRTYRGHGRYSEATPLNLSVYPIVTINTITVDDIVLTSDQYEVSADYGQVWFLQGTTRADWYGETIAVAYTGGWPTVDDVPPEVRAACATYVSYRRSARGRDPALRQVSIPGVMERTYYSAPATTGAGNSLPSEVAAAIEYLRDVRM